MTRVPVCAIVLTKGKENFPTKKATMAKNKFTNMRLDDIENSIVMEKMEKTGLPKSATIRLIIREWNEWRDEMEVRPAFGIQKKYWETEQGIEQSR